ncbi:MAG: hypothetical protein ACYDAP_05235 [Thermoplasmataceae archaeon]
MITRNRIAFMPASVVSTAPDPSKLNETTPRGKIIHQLNEPIEKRPELISMMSRKKNIRHGIGPIRGDDQRTLDVFFKNAPSCSVCGGLYQTGTLSAWIDGHILDCRIPRPQYTGSFNRNDADRWFYMVYLPWVKEKFEVDLA